MQSEPKPLKCSYKTNQLPYKTHKNPTFHSFFSKLLKVSIITSIREVFYRG